MYSEFPKVFAGVPECLYKLTLILLYGTSIQNQK